MLSLYLHIPFCAQKCAYCSFTVLSTEKFPQGTKDSFINKYLEALKKEIVHYGSIFPGEEIKTIYFGGGTPNLIGAENLVMLIEEIKKYFNTENLAELSFEFNPFPQKEIYNIIKKINQMYAKEARVRFSFGIQSLDDEVLKSTNRSDSFGQIVEFLRGLQEYKQENNVFNFDFIAFGKFNETRSGNLQLRDQGKMQFFENFVQSGFADSFSLYTLELFEGSKRRNQSIKSRVESRKSKNQGPEDLMTGGLDDLISEEFQILKEIVLEAGYVRYEISNFTHASKNSIHNMAYRTMENYLGLGLASASFLDEEHAKKLGKNSIVRLSNTKNLLQYIEGKRLDELAIISMTHKDYLIEKFFLALRTNQGIKDLNEFKDLGPVKGILVPNYKVKIKKYQEEEFITPGPHIKLTDTGMDVSNTIITDLLQEI